MVEDGLQNIFVGDDWDVILTGFLLGLFAALFFVLTLHILDGLYLVDIIRRFAYMITVGLITIYLVYAGGGLIAIWIALFPLVLVTTLHTGRSGLAPPNHRELFVSALVVTFAIGAIAYATSKGVVAALRTTALGSRQRGSASDENDASGREQSTREAHASTERDVRFSLPVTRRTFVFAVGGSVTLLGVGAGYVYGLWCKAGLATVSVYNNSGERVEPRISVLRHGIEVFHANPELGLIEQHGLGEGLGRPRAVSYQRAVPIGCSLPKDVTVDVKTDDGASTTETVTFPAPETGFGPSALSTIF